MTDTGRRSTARRALGAARRRWRNRDSPLLSVVVPVYNAADLIEESLQSVLDQQYRNIEIVVVDDGSTDDSLAVVRAFAERHPEVTVLSQPNGGVGVARRTGTEAATGEYLTYVDSDDTVTRTGIQVAMDGLRRSGSDVAVMPYQRREGDVVRPPAPWIRAVHARPAEAVTLAERPDVLVSAIPGGKIFRRAFWDEHGFVYPTVLLAGDQRVAAEAFLKARSLDITGVPAYTWRRMETSISQGHVTAAAVHARHDAMDAVLEILEPLPVARDERILQYLRYNIPNSLLKLERADDDYLDALVERVPTIVRAAPADRYVSEVPAQYRVLHTLLAAGDRDAVWRFVRAEGMQPEMHPSGSEPAGTTVYLPGWGVDAVDPAAYVLTDEQTAARALVRSVRAQGGDLVLDVAAWFPNVELADPSLTVKTDGDLVDVTPGAEPHVVNSRQGAQRRYVRSGWTVTLRGAARRAPRTLTVTLHDGDRTGTASASIPR
ncbi:glycosyltransferase family 2 protein [Aeromicrobium endophyticum]|uniref:Glycosyltransferase family 2 protein n=1 Tax=Aeromicrobium endophyticum TaxID=2292704 RepID=A0A371PAT2_9ACTN|nr:glycosyltransferase family A protein [Aeromicrobium endophyticum]REK72560.1 glycosyltransferase family 2 protein [Aeromicrobium endophyticum]